MCLDGPRVKDVLIASNNDVNAAAAVLLDSCS